MDGFYVAKFKKMDNKFPSGKDEKNANRQNGTAGQDKQEEISFNDDEDAEYIEGKGLLR
jgi:ribosomal RNA methyltransferase Nop2